MMRTYIDKVALVAIKEKKVLMVRSKGKDRYFNPGGKIEAGESNEAALVREIKEELSVNVDPATIVFSGTFEAQAYGKPEGTFVRMYCYTASYHGEPKASSEIEEIRYLSYDERHLSTAVDLLIFDDLKSQDLIL